MSTQLGNFYECKMCGGRFVKVRENQKYCSDECRKDAKYADTKRYREELKAMKRKRKVENNPFNKILKELDEYNRKNNCFLSYGQFMLLKQKAGDTK